MWVRAVCRNWCRGIVIMFKHCHTQYSMFYHYTLLTTSTWSVEGITTKTHNSYFAKKWNWSRHIYTIPRQPTNKKLSISKLCSQQLVTTAKAVADFWQLSKLHTASFLALLNRDFSIIWNLVIVIRKVKGKWKFKSSKFNNYTKTKWFNSNLSGE